MLRFFFIAHSYRFILSHHISFLSFLLFFASLSVASVYASPLDEVLQSQQYNAVSNSKFQYDKKPSWVNENSNYWKIFTENSPSKFIFEWLGEPSTDFLPFGQSQALKTAYIDCSQSYKDKKSGVKYLVRIILPRPSAINMVELGLIRDIAELSPPLLKIIAEQDIEIGGISSKLYAHRPKGCSLLVPFEKNILISVFSEDCQKAGGFSKLIESMNIDRFRTKIAS
jgi:hypothetical protein